MNVATPSTRSCPRANCDHSSALTVIAKPKHGEPQTMSSAATWRCVMPWGCVQSTDLLPEIGTADLIDSHAIDCKSMIASVHLLRRQVQECLIVGTECSFCLGSVRVSSRHKLHFATNVEQAYPQNEDGSPPYEADFDQDSCNKKEHD
jgi:hypothetical protein